jgi:hypothetical protein
LSKTRLINVHRFLLVLFFHFYRFLFRFPSSSNRLHSFVFPSLCNSILGSLSYHTHIYTSSLYISYLTVFCIVSSLFVSFSLSLVSPIRSLTRSCYSLVRLPFLVQFYSRFTHTDLFTYDTLSHSPPSFAS